MENWVIGQIEMVLNAKRAIYDNDSVQLLLNRLEELSCVSEENEVDDETDGHVLVDSDVYVSFRF